MGISGMSMTMYALTYTMRLWELWPRSSRNLLNNWAVEVLSLASLLMVCDILKLIYVNYRKTYQEDLDVLKVKHLVLGCVVVAALFHPTFSDGFLFSYLWTLGFYIDVVALMPQVVMMARGGGSVEAPISHFVAATTLSRCVDLWWWSEGEGIDLGPQGYVFGVNYSGWLIVLVHLLSFMLVADFMYYYTKARLAGSALSEDLALPTDDLC